MSCSKRKSSSTRVNSLGISIFILMNDEILSNLDRVSEQFMIHRDAKGQVLVEKYSQTFIYALVQKHIFDLEALFTENPKQAIDIFDFVYHMLKFTNQPNEETMYVVIQLIDFFKLMCDESQDASSIRFHDISNYICKYNPKIENEYASDGKAIATHHLPIAKNFKSAEELKKRRVRDIDINPPVVLGSLSSDIQRVNKDRIYIDSSKNSHSAIIRVVYSAALYTVFALHQYSDHICLYNPDCTISKYLRPRSPELRNTIILDICWSEKQQRIGATFKDQWLCFWDANDFGYEKVFSTSHSLTVNNDQEQIYYLALINQWITIDNVNRVHFWNLEIEEVQHTIESHEFSGSGIIEVLEIDHLQLTCLAGLTFLTLWDMTVPKMLFRVNVHHSRLHGVVFFRTYQMILTCGYDNIINIYQLHKRYNDGDLMGKLEGHTSLVTAIQPVEKSPMVITSDDKHIIKVWDIRILKCVQTFDLELRQPIGKIIILTEVQAICLVTSRLIVIEMEHCQHSMTHYKHAKQALMPSEVRGTIELQAHPLRVELDCIRRRILVCTKRDVRFIDLMTGRCEKIIKGVIENVDDEITAFRTLQQHKKFILGTQKGQIKIFESDSGDLINEFTGHANEVSALIIDYQNQIVATTSFDSQVLIWREVMSSQVGVAMQQREFKYEKIREIKNAHANMPVIITEMSVYHNLIVTCTNSSTILIWNFEYGKLVATLTLEEDVEPTAITFINGYSVLVVADNQASLYFIHFVVLEETVEITLKERIDKPSLIPQVQKFKKLSGSQSQSQSPSKRGSQQLQTPTQILIPSKQEDVGGYSRLITDIHKDGITVTAASLIGATQSGQLHLFDIVGFFKDLEFQAHCNQRVNYNPHRQSKEDYLQVVNTHKINHWIVAGLQIVLDTHHDETVKRRQRGRKGSQRTIVVVNRTIHPVPKYDVKAHHDQLTYLGVMSFEGENLLVDVQRSLKICTCSSDQYLKVWTSSLELLCSLNINHPLPLKWDVMVNEQEILKFKLAFALKVVHFIRKNCQSQLTVSQARMLEPGNMFKSILSIIRDKGESNTMFLTQVKGAPSGQLTERSSENNVQLLREEYSKRDVLYDKVKNIYQRELQGPSLKQLEEMKKVYNYAQMWKKHQKDQERHLEYLNKKNQQINDEKQKELKQIMQFLHPKFRTRILEDEMDFHERNNTYVAQLEVQLDQRVAPAVQVQLRPPSQQRPVRLSGSQSKVEVPKPQPIATVDLIAAEGKRRSNFQIISGRQLQGLAELAENESQASLPKISMPKSLSCSKLRGTSKTNFFHYAEERQVNEDSTKTSMRATQNWVNQSRFVHKVKLMSDNKGSLISDFQGDQKKQVVQTIGVNLMRKTSNNLFNKIVNKLDQKLRHSKYSYQNPPANSNEVSQRYSVSQDQQDSHLSTSIGRLRVPEVTEHQLKQLQFDEKLEGLILNVRDRVAQSLSRKHKI